MVEAEIIERKLNLPEFRAPMEAEVEQVKEQLRQEKKQKVRVVSVDFRTFCLLVEIGKRNPQFISRTMTDPDLKTTLREFKEYFDLSCESSREIAARIGAVQWTIWDWLAGKSQPKAKTLAKLRGFLDEEAKRPTQGDGIRPIETVPYKIIRPLQQVRYARICPFCRKARGKIRTLGVASFQGVRVMSPRRIAPATH